MERNDSLRMYFPTKDGMPEIAISNKVSPYIERIHVNTKEEMESFFEKEAKKPFSLEDGPLYRICLANIKESENYLLFVAHHIIFDGLSSAVCIRSFVEIYNKLILDNQAINIKNTKSYLEYAVDENEWLKSEDADLERNYWSKELSGELPILDFPFIHQESMEDCGMRKKELIDKHLEEKINTIAVNYKITAFTIFLGAYGLLLHKYTHMKDIIIGTPFAGRHERSLYKMIGNFMNPLPIRINIHNKDSIYVYLLQVWNKFQGAYDNQRLPFHEIAHLTKTNRDSQVSPIYQTLFAYQNYFDEHIEMEGLQTDVKYINNGRPKFDISLSIGYAGKELECIFEYNKAKIPEWMIDNIINHYIRILNIIAENIMLEIKDIIVLNKSEWDTILYKWNDTTFDFKREKMVYKLFEEQVDKSPNDTAVVYKGEKLSYMDLDKWTNKIARYLTSNGIKKNDLVGIFMNRSLEMVASIHGIMKSGAAYVPIDPEYPLERINYMMVNGNLSYILTQLDLSSQIKDAIGDRKMKVVYIDDKNSEYFTMAEERLNLHIEPEDIAYMIYTSGSTGYPKGVMNTNEGLCNRVLWMQKEYNMERGYKVLQKTPYCFDVSVWEFIWPLITGGTLVIAEPEGHKDASYLCKMIVDYEINILHFVPSMLNIFLLDSNVPACTSLKKVFSSGEALNVAAVEKFYKLLPNTELHNLYGPTEAAIDVTYWDCSKKYKKDVVPIGYPIHNTSIYILDDDQKPVPIGAFGELYIGGIGLAKGYYNNVSLTKEKFIKNPFLDTPNERMYKTGDIGRYHVSGVIEYSKRKDFQIKLRGQRIELGEIEAAIEKYPNVECAVAMVYEDTSGLQDLMSFIVLNNIETINQKQLKEYLNESLPKYMIPAFFNVIEEIPLSSNGKADRKKLKTMIVNERAEQKNVIKPRTKIEREIYEICAELLGHNAISVDDNLMDIGAYSLLIASLVYKIRDKFKTDIAFKFVYENPTIEKLANKIETNSESEEDEIDLNHDVNEIISKEILPLLKNDKEEEGVFLTGGTGFIGAFLLDELQKKYNKVYVLVRAKNKEMAEERLMMNQEKYLLALDLSKVEIVLGDLSKDKLGLEDMLYEEISKKTDLIIHNGALVNYAYPYKTLRNANVMGVERIVELATNRRLKQVYYMSSLHVFSDTDAAQNSILYEETEPKHYMDLKIGYSKSKWSGEQILIRRGKQLNLEYKIFRLGRVGGAAKSGAMQSNDFIWKLVKLCLELKLYPQVNMEIRFIPVDSVAKYIADIRNIKDKSSIYHVCNKDSLTNKQMFNLLRDMGFEIVLTSLENWLDAVKEKAKESIINGEYMVVYDLLKNTKNLEEIPREYDATNFERTLEELGMKCPSMDSNLMKKYIRWQREDMNEG
ncbi:amino acid adenylation domain-containing protein [bacterium 1XD42-8]|nr:amino acid adenylation domain-containing protein [bacterium 1XD42-8]